MTKQRIAQIATVVVLAVIAAVVVARRAGDRSSEEGKTPRDSIYAMLEAAREGDVDDFLSHYAGQMRAALDQSVAEKGKEGFAAYLRESHASVKGVAVTAPEELSPTAVKARVEYVYQDRNEVQVLHMEKTSSEWRIVRVDGGQWRETPVPYGTPED